MVVTPDVIGVIIAGFGLAATLLGGTWAMLTHTAKRIEAQLITVKGELVEVKDELVEVKIALARLEGPQQRLLYGRG